MMMMMMTNMKIIGREERRGDRERKRRLGLGDGDEKFKFGRELLF